MRQFLIALGAAVSATAVLAVAARVSMSILPLPQAFAVFDALEATSRLHYYVSFPIAAAVVGLVVGYFARSAVVVTAVCGTAPVLFFALIGASSVAEWSLTLAYAVLAGSVASVVSRRRARQALEACPSD